MRNILFILTIFSFLPALGQFDYELYKQYSDSISTQQNRQLISQTEFQLMEKDSLVKNSFIQFNAQGLPVLLIQYDLDGSESEKKEFVYDPNGQLSNIETFHKDKHHGTSDFEMNKSGRIISYTDYTYSSLNGEKIFLWKTFLKYYPNGAMEKSIKLEGDRKDTVEINYFDPSGNISKAIWNRSGLRTRKIEYVWNKSKTEMKENHYENDTTIYTFIEHKYKDNKEVERLDPSTSSQLFYWKYDDLGRLVETNEALYFILYLKYDKNGRLENKTMNVLFSDSPNDKDLPQKIQYQYVYQTRN